MSKSKQVILMLKDHPEIQALIAEIKQTTERFSERAQFLTKQLEAISLAADAEAKVRWEAIEKYCMDTGALPADYKPADNNLSFDLKGLYLLPKESGGPADIAALFNAFKGTLTLKTD